MKINYSDFNLKKIYYKDKEYLVSLIGYDESGIKLSFNGNKFLEDFIYSSQQYYLEKLKCISDNDEKMTLFEVRFTIGINLTGGFYAHIMFSIVVYDFVDSVELKCNTLRVTLDNCEYSIQHIFSFHEVNLNDSTHLILGDNYFSFRCSVAINASELYSTFISFYEYFNLLVGFFSPIVNISYFCDDNEFKYKFNVVEKYITKNEYRKNNLLFSSILNEDEFLISFNKFHNLREKISVPLDVYYCSMMKNNVYPEYAIVNLLQAFDGMFDQLSIFEDKKKTFENQKKKNIINRYMNVDISDITDKFSKSRLSDLLGHMNKPSFSIKIENVLNIYEKLFEYEKNNRINEEKTYFDLLLTKLVNTRNKFSHALIRKNKYLTKLESTIYILKLFIAFRLCIMNEIGIQYDDKLLDDYILKLNVKINNLLDLESKEAEL